MALDLFFSFYFYEPDLAPYALSFPFLIQGGRMSSRLASSSYWMDGEYVNGLFIYFFLSFFFSIISTCSFLGEVSFLFLLALPESSQVHTYICNQTHVIHEVLLLTKDTILLCRNSKCA